MADLRRVTPIAIDAPFSDRQLYGRMCRVHGFAVAETTGAATASFTLRNGSGTGGVAAVPVNLAASESAREWWGESGVMFDDGVFLDTVSGSVTGSVWISEEASDVSIAVSTSY